MMTATTLFSSIRRNGDVYASVAYLLASLVLALSAHGIGHLFDTAAGVIWFLTDVLVIALKSAAVDDRKRFLVFFGGSVAGSMAYIAGGIVDQLFTAATTPALAAALCQIVTSILFLIAGIAGLHRTIARTESKIPLLILIASKPGAYYMTASAINLVFAVIQYGLTPSIAAMGYIGASLLWLAAGFCIRLSVDLSR